MLTSYRRLFAIPHVRSLLLWSLVARLYMPGLPIAVTFLVAGWTGSYTLAGLVVGAFTLGVALVGPLRGRMADRGGVDRLVLVCALAFATGLLALCLLPGSHWWTALPLALVTGLFSSPANQIVRGLWPRITSGPDRQAVYAAEATLQELVFVFSPVLAAGAVALAGPRTALALLAALGLAGALGLVWALRRAGLTGAAPAEEGEPSAAGPRRSLLRIPALSALVALLLLMIGGIIGVDLAIVAWANELRAPEYVMVLASIWALGSVAGGLIAGALPGRPHLTRRAAAAALGIVLLVPFAPPITDLPTPLLAAPALFVSGLTIAPTLAAAMGRLSDLAPPHRRSEAFGWMNTATATGGAIAAPLTGALVDLGGIASGMGGAAVLVAVAAALTVFVPAAARPRTAELTRQGD